MKASTPLRLTPLRLTLLRSIPITPIVLCWALAGAPAVAADWPQFRGPGRDGHAAATELPLEWSADDGIAWKRVVPGQGWSSPVLHQGRVYLTTAVAKSDDRRSDQALVALCLDALTGETIWSKEIFVQDGATAPTIQGKNSHASPTPLVAGDRLYVHFGHQGTACLDLDGNILWSTQELTYPPEHGGGASPILVGDALVFSCDGARDPFIAALSRHTGEVLWRVPRQTDARDTFSFSTAQLIEVDGRPQIISAGSNVVSALDPADGSEIWRVRYDGYSVIPQPVFGHGMIFISTGFNPPNVMAIRVDGQGDVTDTHVAWTLRKRAPHTPSLLLVGDELYMISDDGVATCLDARSGTVVWQERIGGNFSASPLYAAGRIYLQSEEGTGTVLRAGKTFEKLATNPLAERSLASYAIGEDFLIIRTADHLYRIGP